MNLNSVDIHKIILMSRKKLNFWNLLIRGLSVFTCFICAAGLFCNNILHQTLPWTCWVGAGGITVLKIANEIIIHRKAKAFANQQLTTLAKYLNQEGIDVKRISLKKALVAEKFPRQVSDSHGITKVVESVTIFRDRSDQLKALKQVRSELVKEYRPLETGDVIEGDYVEIIEDRRQVEKILEQMPTRRRF